MQCLYAVQIRRYMQKGKVCFVSSFRSLRTKNFTKQNCWGSYSAGEFFRGPLDSKDLVEAVAEGDVMELLAHKQGTGLKKITE